jgi:hypothetical protein
MNQARTSKENSKKMARLLKHSVVAGIVVACAVTATAAQDKSGEKTAEPATKLESSLAKRGRLILTDSYELGTMVAVGEMKMDALVIYEPGAEQQRIRGIRIVVSVVRQSSTSFLDMEEIDSLSKAIEYMTILAGAWNAGNRDADRKVTFSTRGDFSLSFYHNKSETSGFASSGAVMCFFELKDLRTLKEMIDKGSAILQTK